MRTYIYLGVGAIGLVIWLLLSRLRSNWTNSLHIRNPGALQPDPELEKISYQQGMLLLVTLVISTADVFLPAITAQDAGTDSWLAVLLATLVTLGFGFVYINLALRFPGQTVVEYSGQLLGRIPGVITGLGYFWFFLHQAVMANCFICSIVTTAFMPETPSMAWAGAMAIWGAYAVKKGLEVIARSNEFLVPVGLGLIFWVIVLNLGNMDLSNYLPVLEDGFKPVVKGALDIIPYLGETVFILMLIPFFNQAAGERPHRIYGGMAAALITLGLSLLLGTLILAVFGVELTASFTFPALMLIRQVSLAGFLERIDALIVVIWTSGIFVKFILYYYGAVLCLSRVLGLKTYRPLVLPVGIITAQINVLGFNTVIEHREFLRGIYPFYALVPELVIPLLLLLVAAIKGFKAAVPAGEGLKQEKGLKQAGP